MIETLSAQYVEQTNRTPYRAEDLPFSPQTVSSAMKAMETLWADKSVRNYYKDLAKLMDKSPWLDSGFGVYFATVANMKTTYGPRILPKINSAYGSEWSNTVELGSGVGTIEPCDAAVAMLATGVADPDRLTQYDSPGGTYPDRWAGAMILNAKIDRTDRETINNPVYTFRDTYITPSATYAVDLAYEAFSRYVREQNSTRNRIVVLGPSYYILPFAARDKELPVTRITNTEPVDWQGKRYLFPDTYTIGQTVPDDTGMIVVTLPNNPTGERYLSDELKKLFALAKEKNVLIMLDLLFDQLQDPWEQSQNSPLQMAYEAGALDRVIVVDGLSKTLNVSGERIGILATKNQDLERIINRVSISRLSNPSLTVGPLLQFEVMARFADRELETGRPAGKPYTIELVLELVRNYLNRSTNMQWLPEFPDITLPYLNRSTWLEQARTYYEDNVAILNELFGKRNRPVYSTRSSVDYNAFFGFGSSPGNAGVDKIMKLFLSTGIVAMNGQCFGYAGKTDEFWTRITTGGLSREKMIEAANRLLCFLDFWEEKDLGNAQKYPVFDREISFI